MKTNAVALPALLASIVALPPDLCRRFVSALPTFFQGCGLSGVGMALATLASLWVAPVAAELFRMTLSEQEQRALWQRLRLSGAR
jgi:hypothetical protein